MKQMLTEAGHNKFKSEELLSLEREILLTLDFIIMSKNIYQEASIIFREVIFKAKLGELASDDLLMMYNFIEFICKMSVTSLELSLLPIDRLAVGIVNISFKFWIETKILYEQG
jgi:hypothetical protein